MKDMPVVVRGMRVEKYEDFARWMLEKGFSEATVYQVVRSIGYALSIEDEEMWLRLRRSTRSKLRYALRKWEEYQREIGSTSGA